MNKEKLWSIFRAAAPASVSMNHYELAASTEVNDSEVWKAFLKEADVIDWVKEERALLQQIELAKLSTDIANQRSVGQAQLITAMNKINEQNEDKTKQGPAFIYTYIPLNENQKHAENVQEETEDVFLKGDKDGPDFNLD